MAKLNSSLLPPIMNYAAGGTNVTTAGVPITYSTRSSMLVVVTFQNGDSGLYIISTNNSGALQLIKVGGGDVITSVAYAENNTYVVLTLNSGAAWGNFYAFGAMVRTS